MSTNDSDSSLRLRHITKIAARVFGNPDKAHRWLRTENLALDGGRPIDLLASETGAYFVEEELHGIDFGMLA